MSGHHDLSDAAMQALVDDLLSKMQSRDPRALEMGADIERLLAKMEAGEAVDFFSEISGIAARFKPDLETHLRKPSRRRALGVMFMGALAAGVAYGAGTAGQMALNGVEVVSKRVVGPIEARVAGVVDNPALKAVDTLATLHFVAKIYRLASGKEDGVNPSDYATAMGLNLARCVVGGAEVTRHTLHEHVFGFTAAGAAIAAGLVCEGFKANLNEIAEILLGRAPGRPERVAAIAVVASAVSPLIMTISSASMLGDEIRQVCWDPKAGKVNEKAMSVLMGHTGDHSALFSLGLADPPDIPFLAMVGYPAMVSLKTVYGLPPALYSFWATIYKVNYALNGGDAGLAAQETMQGVRSVLPVLPVFMKQSVLNGLRALGGNDLDPRGMDVEVRARMQEALNNICEITLREQPRCRHVFAHHHGFVSELMQQLSGELSTFAGNQIDPGVARLEQAMDRMAEAQDQRIERHKHLRDLVHQGLLANDKSTADACFAAAVGLSDQLDEGNRLKPYLASLWTVSSRLHTVSGDYDWPTDIPAMARAVNRLTEKERLANALGHEQMDVVTLLPWQLLLSVPLSAQLEWGLAGLGRMGLGKTATGAVNMGLTGAVTATVDNLAAFLSSANAGLRSGRKTLMQSLMASIVFGSGTWGGNPIPHGKIASGSAKPGAAGHEGTVYGLKESMRTGNMAMNADTYAVTVAWTLLMDSLNMEERIFNALGQTHPALREQRGGHHARLNAPGPRPA